MQSHRFTAWSIVLLICGLSQSTIAQIVNIESKRMQTDSTRFVFRGDLSASYNDNDGVYLFQTGVSLTSQFKSKDLNTIYFLLGDYNLIRAEDKDFQNAWFLHFRINRGLTDFFRLESYLQSQNNKILDVKARNLVGVGIRLELVSTKNITMYLGEGYMYESETAQLDGLRQINHRNSAYISTSMTFPKSRINLVNTIYYQALYNNWSDHRIVEQLKLDITLSDKISYFTLMDYFFDSLTPRDRSQFSFKIKMGIGVKL